MFIFRSKRKYFVGDLNSDDFSTPRKAKRNWQIARNAIIVQRQKNKSLQRTRRRLKDRVISLTSLLKYLRNNQMISETAQESLQVSRIHLKC